MPSKRDVPDGHHAITPYFTIADADRLIEFLTAAFGAKIIKYNKTEDDRVQHARVQIGDSIIMMHEATDDYPVNVSQMHLYVEEVDRTFETALACGASPLMSPNIRPHGDRMAGVEDPCGNIWWIATYRHRT